MNATQWVMRATEGMPPGVVSRVRAETLAHLEDAEVAAEADVRPWLGHPEDTRVELGRLYLTHSELEALQQDSRNGVGMERVVLWGLPLLLLTGMWREDPLRYGLALALVLVALGLTWSLPPVRRRRLRVLLFFVVLSAVLWIPDLWSLTGLDNQGLWLALPLFLALVGWQNWQRDARLRRILALDRAA